MEIQTAPDSALESNHIWRDSKLGLHYGIQTHMICTNPDLAAVKLRYPGLTSGYGQFVVYNTHSAAVTVCLSSNIV